ncbi:MAG: SO_0444 family Cu/Zn efflux transporter [Planctomycetota bacterium]
MAYVLEIVAAFWGTLAEMAPWLLFGFFAAGVLSVFFPPSLIERHLGRGRVGPVVKASILGAPLPICSCGVIPVGAGLFRHGASRGATSSFLLSTPQTGVDSIFATYALMGPVFAVVRPVVALTTGIVGGLVIDSATRRDEPSGVTEPAAKPVSGCGGESSGCCSSTEANDPKWWGVLRYAFITLPADLVGSLVVGLMIAALLTALVPADTLSPYLGGGLVAMLAAIAVSTPLYVCATASIPIGLGLLAVGASPGAVLAFLIAGPATNAATVSVTWRVMGRTTGLLYVGVVVAAAVAAGLGLDALFTVDSLRLPAAALDGHEHGMTWVDHLWAVALMALLLPALLGRIASGSEAKSGDEPATPPTPETQHLTITGMTCSHCSASVERSLREVPGVRDVIVDLRGGAAEVRGAGVEPAALVAAVEGLGFGVGPIDAPPRAALQSDV